MLLQVLWVNGRMFAGQGLSRWLGRALVVFMVVDGLELAELSQSVCLTWAVSDRDRSRRARNTVSCHSRRTGAALMIYYRSVLFALGSSQLDSSKHGPQTQETPTHKYPFQHASSVEGILCVCVRCFFGSFLGTCTQRCITKKSVGLASRCAMNPSWLPILGNEGVPC